MMNATPHSILLLGAALFLAVGTPVAAEAQRQSPTQTAPKYDVKLQVAASSDAKPLNGATIALSEGAAQ